MSHLIEDSSFQTSISQIQKIFHHRSLMRQDLSLLNKPNLESSNSKKVTRFPNIFSIMSSNQIYIHKSQLLTLNVLRKSFDNKKYYFQGLIFQKANKFMIKHKQKRILFGKQWMKQKTSSNVKMSLSFNTGQIRLFWPEVFYISQQSILQPKATFKKLFGSVFMEFVAFFNNQFIPVCKKIIFCNHSESTLSENKNQKYEIQKKMNQQKETQIMQRYLYMSTVIDTFEREKQSYKRIQEKVLKQKENIVKVQNNIDMSFSNISLQLNLFTQNSIKKIRKRLEIFGELSTEQHKKLSQSFRSELNKCNNENQCQYIFNGIGILKIENKKRFISSGGTCNVYMAKMIFQYIFSDDSKFWIEENKKNSQNAIEKCFAIKQAKEGFEDKIKHQNQIVRQMKGGFSIYLPKYYRIQNLQKDAIQFKTENLVIMDFFKGETLYQFAFTNRDTLSFWTKIFIVRNIVNGLRFISSYKIVHLDLKPSNIIVINGLLTKMIDFSQSYHSHISDKNFLPGISLPYSCPDILSSNQKCFDQKYDIFSLGVIMFELFINDKMFEIPKDKMFKLYESKQYMRRVFICPQQIEEENLSPIINIILILILRCLDPRPQYRPTLNWIMIIIGLVLTYFKGK